MAFSGFHIDKPTHTFMQIHKIYLSKPRLRIWVGKKNVKTEDRKYAPNKDKFSRKTRASSKILENLFKL